MIEIKMQPSNCPSCFCFLAEKALSSPPETSQPTDFLMHCLALDIIRSSSHRLEKLPFSTDEGKRKEMNESPRCDKVHANTISIPKLSCFHWLLCFVLVSLSV